MKTTTKRAIMEAHDNAEAARLNLETAFARPESDRSGLLRNARQQLAKALELLKETEVAPKPKASDMPRLAWTRLETGVEVAQIGDYQLQVFKTSPSKHGHVGRGLWVSFVHRRVPNKEALEEKSHSIDSKSKTEARASAIGDVLRFIDDEEQRRLAARAAGIGYDKLERALGAARAQARSNRLSCGYDGSATATLDDVQGLVDSFVSDLVYSLKPESS